MEMIIAIALILLIILGILLDATDRINLVNKYFLAIYMLIYPNIIVFFSLTKEFIGSGVSSESYVLLFILMIAGTVYMFARINLFPYTEKKDAGIRLNIMYGGRVIIYCGLYAFAMQFIIIFGFYGKLVDIGIGDVKIISSIVFSIVSILLLLANGILRIFFTSYRLGIKNRIIMLVTAWIPVVNLIVLINACRMVYEEFDFEYQRIIMKKIRINSDICKTKYPLLMVHGLGFRDLKYFNYWGRIPAAIIENGGTVHYGHQEAFGTVLDNAKLIKDKVMEVIETTGAEKVNIIAHSKGGLDSRYAISMFGLDEYVASLTTINTPHRGCKIVDHACKLPDKFYRFVANQYDRMFKRIGDDNPDFYSATRHLSTEALEKFNEVIKDSDKVYYQSYASKMKNMFSDGILFLTYSFIRILEGENDGLVAIGSAKWGEFQGVFRNDSLTGVSHGDIIDLKRKDYVGFDVREEYVNIVSELKIKGF